MHRPCQTLLCPSCCTSTCMHVFSAAVVGVATAAPQEVGYIAYEIYSARKAQRRRVRERQKTARIKHTPRCFVMSARLVVICSFLLFLGGPRVSSHTHPYTYYYTRSLNRGRRQIFKVPLTLCVSPPCRRYGREKKIKNHVDSISYFTLFFYRKTHIISSDTHYGGSNSPRGYQDQQENVYFFPGRRQLACTTQFLQHQNTRHPTTNSVNYYHDHDLITGS